MHRVLTGCVIIGDGEDAEAVHGRRRLLSAACRRLPSTLKFAWSDFPLVDWNRKSRTSQTSTN